MGFQGVYLRLYRSPNGIRTRVSTLRGWCPWPLDDGAGHPFGPSQLIRSAEILIPSDRGPDPDTRTYGRAVQQGVTLPSPSPSFGDMSVSTSLNRCTSRSRSDRERRSSGHRQHRGDVRTRPLTHVAALALEIGQLRTSRCPSAVPSRPRALPISTRVWMSAPISALSVTLVMKDRLILKQSTGNWRRYARDE